MNLTMTRLLVISCSGRKHPGPARAVDLYDGPAFKVLHKAKSRTPVAVLSAKYGIVAGGDLLETYDRKMDEHRAREFCESKKYLAAARSAVGRLEGWPFAEVFCYGGALYRRVVRAYADEGVFGPKARVSYSDGRIGEQLHQLKAFLLDDGRRTPPTLWGAKR